MKFTFDRFLTEKGYPAPISRRTGIHIFAFLLSRIIGKPRMAVNSAHHQAVKDVGPEVAINATAPDDLSSSIRRADSTMKGA